MNVSLGGAAALFPSPPAGGDLDLMLALDAFKTRLPSDAVDIRSVEGGYLAQLRFRPLDFAQSALVRQLVAEAKSRLATEAAA